MAGSDETQDEDEEVQGLIGLVINTLLKPFRIISSKPARRAYLTTFLVVSAGLILLGFAITAYTLFYWSYIPRIGFERTIHLQFDNVYSVPDSRYGASRVASPYPYGTIVLSPDIASVQRYDVIVELTLPRTPENTEAGNFMLEASMYAPQERTSNVYDTVIGASAARPDDSSLLALSRRPAILPYRSYLTEYAYKLTELHWYLLGWRAEVEYLRVSMFEQVEFAKGRLNLPATMRLEIQSTHRMQVYSARAVFRARFRGLRWLMYNHRMLSAIVFVSTFWTTEMIFAGLAWGALTLFTQSPNSETMAKEVREVAERVKPEQADEEDVDRKPALSDTERTFPTTSRQPPLQYRSPKIKQEDDDGSAVFLPAAMASKEVEADDEDEDADFFLDSGLGTSMESSASRRDSMRRRRGRSGSGGGR